MGRFGKPGTGGFGPWGKGHLAQLGREFNFTDIKLIPKKLKRKEGKLLNKFGAEIFIKGPVRGNRGLKNKDWGVIRKKGPPLLDFSGRKKGIGKVTF